MEACNWRRGYSEEGRNRVHNVPLERSGRHRGTFATWDVKHVAADGTT